MVVDGLAVWSRVPSLVVVVVLPASQPTQLGISSCRWQARDAAPVSSRSLEDGRRLFTDRNAFSAASVAIQDVNTPDSNYS